MDRAGKSRQEDVDLVQGACGQIQRVVHEMSQVTLACGSASCVKLAIIFCCGRQRCFGLFLVAICVEWGPKSITPPLHLLKIATPPPPHTHLPSFLSYNPSSITARHTRSHPSAAAPTPGWPDIHSIPFSESFHHRSSAQPGGVCCGHHVIANAQPIFTMCKRSRPVARPAMSWNANSCR